MDEKCEKSGKVSTSKPFFDCQICGKILHEYEYKYCQRCQVTELNYEDEYEEDELEEAYEDYANGETWGEPGPCDDCDDRTFPVAMRSCDTCEHGSYYMKQKVKPCNCNRKLTDDEQYQHDMWGCPNNE